MRSGRLLRLGLSTAGGRRFLRNIPHACEQRSSPFWWDIGHDGVTTKKGTALKIMFWSVLLTSLAFMPFFQNPFSEASSCYISPNPFLNRNPENRIAVLKRITWFCPISIFRHPLWKTATTKKFQLLASKLFGAKVQFLVFLSIKFEVRHFIPSMKNYKCCVKPDWIVFLYYRPLISTGLW